MKDYEVVRQGLIAETDILKRLNHPHLPSIIDVIDREDTFLIVMDYIEGKALDYWLKKEGAQPQERVVEWAKQICDVFGYLHSRKPPIIYRDLKPANVMLKPDGQIMIIDFGTAREFKETSIEDTSCLGTQGYAAPEQYGGHGQTDARTDIYTLGATMYHLLTGHNPSLPPYEMYPIRRWNPALSSGLEEIVLKCTQRNPNDRYQSCAELMYALEHYGELDQEYRKRQMRKWRTFVAMCSLTAASLLGCVGFKVGETMTTKSSYEGYIKEAANSPEQSEREKYYTDAIKIDPRREKRITIFCSYASAEQTGRKMILTEKRQRGLRRFLDIKAAETGQMKVILKEIKKNTTNSLFKWDWRTFIHMREEKRAENQCLKHGLKKRRKAKASIKIKRNCRKDSQVSRRTMLLLIQWMRADTAQLLTETTGSILSV